MIGSISRRTTSGRPGKNFSKSSRVVHDWSSKWLIARAASKKPFTFSAGTRNRSIKQLREILAVEGGFEREHRVVEADVLELHDRVGDFGRPVAAAAFDHADGKAVQRDIEDMPALAMKPRGQPAEFVMLFDQQHRMARPGERVRGRHAGQTGADDDDVVGIAEIIELIRHSQFIRSWVLGLRSWVLDNKDSKPHSLRPIPLSTNTYSRFRFRSGSRRRCRPSLGRCRR